MIGRKLCHRWADGGVHNNTLTIDLRAEQWTFGPTLGKALSRGLEEQPDIELAGLAYMQTDQKSQWNRTSGLRENLPYSNSAVTSTLNLAYCSKFLMQTNILASQCDKTGWMRSLASITPSNAKQDTIRAV